MTIVVHGVAGNMDATEWTTLGMDMAPMKVATGLKVSPGGSARQVSVASGRSYQAGTDAISDAAATLTLGTNTSGLSRIDTVCMQVNLGADEATAGSLVVVAGTPGASPVPHALTQTPGGTWQTPLAYVTVVNNKTTTFTAGEISDARPGIVSDKVNTSFPGNYADDTVVPMYVQRIGAGTVQYGGRFKRITTNAAAGTTLTQNNVIPVGYRPAVQVATLGVGGVISGPVVYVLLEVNPDGSVDITPLTNALTTNTTVRINTVTWIGA